MVIRAATSHFLAGLAPNLLKTGVRLQLVWVSNGSAFGYVGAGTNFPTIASLRSTA
jgi:hypothetical protein